VARRAPAPQLNDPGGFALSASVLASLSTVGIRQTGWRWRYNSAVNRPTGSFGPHLELAGSFVQTLPTDEGWTPGDHNGCRCQAAPVLRGPDGRFLATAVADDDD
jgi:hypothetical protein